MAYSETDGKDYLTNFYNLDVIISVGYLVALTLMIAESDPKERDIIVNLAVNLINKNN